MSMLPALMREPMFVALFTVIVSMCTVAGPSDRTGAVPARIAIDMTVYSDFQCPFCAQFAKPFRELQTKGIDEVDITVTFKHFPLSIHPDAQLAHQAAEAAKAQGKFWEMHDLLFANQRRVQREDLLGYAKQLGLD